MDTTTMEILPCKRTAIASSWLLSPLVDDLLVEILIRLPESKTLIQFKLVCKHWNFIISSHYFIRRCAANHRPKANSFTLIPQFYFRPHSSLSKFPEPILYTASGNTRPHLDIIPKIAAVLSPNPSIPEKFSIEASFNDLVLLSYTHTVFYLVNPQTRHWISLPPPPPPPTLPPGPKKTGLKYGLLCNYTDAGVRYKVIRIPYIMWDGGNDAEIDGENYSGEFSVEIFCSESKQWRVYIVDWYHSRLNHCLFRNPIVSNNGMFHWVNGVSLVSLNPSDLVLIGDQLRPNRMIELPRAPLVIKRYIVANSADTILFGFGVNCGRLCVMTKVDSKYSSLLVWKLHEKASANPWKLEIKVPPKSPIKKSYKTLYFRFLGFHPYLSGVILIAAKYMLQINLRTHCSKYLKKEDEQYKQAGWSSSPSGRFLPLLHQWLPTKLTS